MHFGISWARFTQIVRVSALAITLVTAAGPHAAYADEASPQAPQITWSAHDKEIRIARWVDPRNGMREFRYDRRESRMLSADTWNPVLFARDLDGNGKPDAFFYRDEKGLLEWKDQASADVDGWDVAQGVLKNEIPDEDRLLAGMVLNQVLSATLASARYAQSEVANAVQDELNLASLQVFAVRLSRANPLDPQVPKLFEMASLGYEQAIERFGASGVTKFAFATAVDAVIYAGGYVISKGLSFALGWAGGRLAQLETVSAGLKVYERYIAALQVRSGRLLTAAGTASRRIGGPTLVAAARLAAKIDVRQEIGVTLQALTARSRFAQVASEAMGKVISKTGGVMTAAAREGATPGNLAYTAVVQTTQVLAEGRDKYEVIYDPNPIVLAGNFVTNKEIMQNLAYMTNETFWMSGISSHLEKIGVGLLGRIGACAFFSFVDSTAVNLLMKGTTDPVRTGFDTGWEVGIGNLQTQLDRGIFAGLRYMEERSNIKGLHFIGYVTTLVNQSVGYQQYAKHSKSVDNDDKTIRMVLIPVLGRLRDNAAGAAANTTVAAQGSNR
jgi:hypothetical protein